MRRVSRRREDEHVALLGEGHAVLKRAECSVIETDEARLPPPRPAVGQIALDSSAQARGSIEFLFGYPGTRIGQVSQSTSVIRVKVCQHDMPDISGCDPQLPQMGANFLIRMN